MKNLEIYQWLICLYNKLTYLLFLSAVFAFRDSFKYFLPPFSFLFKCSRIFRTSKMSSDTSFLDSPWWALFLFLIRQTISSSSSGCSTLKCSFSFLTFPSSLLLMVPRSLIKGNFPVFSAACPHLLFSLHHSTAFCIWDSLALMSLLYTVASALLCGFVFTLNFLGTLYMH